MDISKLTLITVIIASLFSYLTYPYNCPKVQIRNICKANFWVCNIHGCIYFSWRYSLGPTRKNTHQLWKCIIRIQYFTTDFLCSSFFQSMDWQLCLNQKLIQGIYMAYTVFHNELPKTILAWQGYHSQVLCFSKYTLKMIKKVSFQYAF